MCKNQAPASLICFAPAHCISWLILSSLFFWFLMKNCEVFLLCVVLRKQVQAKTNRHILCHLHFSLLWFLFELCFSYSDWIDECERINGGA
jgi:hypothetical protein